MDAPSVETIAAATAALELDGPSALESHSSHETRDKFRFVGRSPPYDFTVECADGSLAVHGNVLASASTYFRALFNSSMVETESRVVRLTHISSSTMTKIIDFIYSRWRRRRRWQRQPVQLRAENILNMLITADYLHVPELITDCLERIKMCISVENAIDVFNTADRHCMRDLCEFATRFLANNIASLMTDDLFLDMVDARLMQALLESDDLRVPHEDSVFEFLRDWLRKDRQGRARYAVDLKELIRFPFLMVPTVTLLEKKLGPLRGLERLETMPWDLELPAFKRRKYTVTHCHLLWQERRSSHWTKNTPERFMVTCHALGQTYSVVYNGPWAHMPDAIKEPVMSGHTMYTRDSRVVYRARLGIEECFIRSPSNGEPYENIISRFPVLLHANKDGHLCTMLYPNVSKVQAFNTSAVDFEPFTEISSQPCGMSDMIGCSLTLNWSHQNLIDTETGHWIELRTPTIDPEGTIWRYVAQIDETVFLWYECRSRQKLFMTTLNLSTGHWGRNVESSEYGTGYDVHVKVIQGHVYTVTIKPDSNEGVLFYKLDDTGRAFHRVEHLQPKYTRFTGIVPTDMGPQCPSETWLAARCRKLPDKTPDQRAFIQKLREISGYGG